jgi:hypothetical protein
LPRAKERPEKEKSLGSALKEKITMSGTASFTAMRLQFFWGFFREGCRVAVLQGFNGLLNVQHFIGQMADGIPISLFSVEIKGSA